MLPTFVIGLREGLEAALIVGIVAAFLRKQGRSDLLRWVFLGIATAIGLCAAAGVALDVVSRDLPQRQQEGLETVIGACAVAMVSYMVIWMRRHSRDLKGQLEGAAGAALAAGSGWALVAMAFLAVLREGLETAVFLLAAFNESGSGPAAGAGAVLGVLIACGLGYSIYRGGVRLNLSKFFRATGVVLVLVAAGLVLSALHTAHEAGWLNAGQQQTVDLSGLVRPGSIQASVLTGVLGLQPRPVLIELIGWLAYLVPMVLYVAWPPGLAVSRARLARVGLVAGTVSAAVALALAVLAPGRPVQRPATAAAGFSAQVLALSGKQAVIRVGLPASSAATSGAAALTAPRPVRTQDVRVTRTGTARQDGVPVDVYSGSQTSSLTDRPARLGLDTLAELNGGRLPLGVRSTAGTVAARYTATDTQTFSVSPASHRVTGARWQESVTVSVETAAGDTPVAARSTSTSLPAAGAASAARAAAGEQRTADRRRLMITIAGLLGVLAAGLLLAGALALARGPRRGEKATAGPAPAGGSAGADGAGPVGGPGAGHAAPARERVAQPLDS